MAVARLMRPFSTLRETYRPRPFLSLGVGIEPTQYVGSDTAASSQQPTTSQIAATAQIGC